MFNMDGYGNISLLSEMFNGTATVTFLFFQKCSIGTRTGAFYYMSIFFFQNAYRTETATFLFFQKCYICDGVDGDGYGNISIFLEMLV
jgi:hypothetical protein